ncbi:PAAR domain-containing protein [Pseudomonas sp. NyZ480]|uniref:PAAR domain-containing protein n=1 Tax=Pseudomonas sp. NyZ480 TaxID=3035289 RepID=UPI00240A2AE5|nr:PAAR domain-containing protein [Pseudomonas sp. NyZ480]WEZ88553.1 PAAR domain-containing protein [Pseudomonas sp. NyZ480]
MNQRTNIFGNGQGLDGDVTTTGATCIASHSRGTFNGRRWLIEGDRTTACPRCGEEGVIIEGEQRWMQDGRPTAVDGSLVKCGCPLGSNRVLAPLNQGPAPRRMTAAGTVVEAQVPAQATPHVNRYRPSAFQSSTAPQGMEPGFYIVPRCMTYQEVLIELGAPQANLPSSILQRLNPTYQQGFKAGEIFVIGDGLSRPVCTREELYSMSAAKQAREALASLTPEEAEFMMQHQADIAGLLGEVSLAMGVSEAMLAKALDELTATLKNIESLHQQQFAKYGHLRSSEFFAERKKLLKQLDANLKATFLNKHLNLGNYERLRRDLGISSRNLVHHWRSAGAPGQIPGYSTHLDKLARMSTYLKAGGYIGIAVGGLGSATKVSAVCREGNTKSCKKVKVAEAGSFSVGLAGGWAGAKIGGLVATQVCGATGPGALICGVALTGVGALAGSVVGMEAGETFGEIIFEAIQDD